MHSVIIADDEKWIVEGIKAGVNWKKYGFEVIDTAENGQEALDLIQLLHPTLVLTDIKMPVMNGLELIQRGKKVAPDTIFIVLSGHAEFAYAQKAMNYGTYGYCLKPFEIEEIEGMLGRIVQHLETKTVKVKPALDFELYEAVCSGDFDQINRWLNGNQIPLSRSMPSVPIVVQGLSAPVDIGHFPTLVFPMSSRRYGYLIIEKHYEAFLQSLEDAEILQTCGIGIGPSISNIHQLDSSLEFASLAAFNMFTTGKPGCYQVHSQQEHSIDENLKEISRILRNHDRLGFIATMESIKKQFREGTYTMKEAYLLYTSILYLFPREGTRINGRFFEGYEQLYYRYGTAEAMIDDLVLMTLDLLMKRNDTDMIQTSNKKVKEIVLYIRNHFNQEISIQHLANQFYLSPNYLCQLFKKEVGETIVEYISRLRIESACKMLVNTDLSISQIGEKSGFQDYFYFTRIFKRHLKMTPTQYREKNNENI
ncbi:response regulator [Paenibacillus sp. MBLB2552]|uniref:Response regulator n=1 Tax=Paenibacillus mellifer TaxID=2937794 RepID=A0A9X1XZS6_9BACL|nr:helix-turn-helix domain-containing protein [Paenibacillus mellifer]MCK8487948.1 response regulator [Paenibacillus mellifer]